MILRDDQIRALTQVTRKGFEQRLYEQLAKYWPDECARMGEWHVRRMIRNARHSAMTYGIETEYDILRFLNVMFAVGKDFESNPDCRWMVQQLEDKRFDPTSSLDIVCRRISENIQVDSTNGE